MSIVLLGVLNRAVPLQQQQGLCQQEAQRCSLEVPPPDCHASSSFDAYICCDQLCDLQDGEALPGQPLSQPESDGGYGAANMVRPEPACMS